MLRVGYQLLSTITVRYQDRLVECIVAQLRRRPPTMAGDPCKEKHPYQYLGEARPCRPLSILDFGLFRGSTATVLSRRAVAAQQSKDLRPRRSWIPPRSELLVLPLEDDVGLLAAGHVGVHPKGVRRRQRRGVSLIPHHGHRVLPRLATCRLVPRVWRLLSLVVRFSEVSAPFVVRVQGHAVHTLSLIHI